MRRLLLLASLLISTSIIAQQKTLVKTGGFGGFLSFNNKFTELNNQNAYLFGSQVSLSLAHSLNIGAVAHVLVSDVSANLKDSLGNPYYLEMGYGGLCLEPVIGSNAVVHVTLPCMVGIGAANLDRRRYYDYVEHDIRYDDKTWYDDWFMVAETGLNAEVNVFRHMRLNTGVSYRFTDGFRLNGIDPKSMSGWNMNVSLKFGWF